MRTPDRLSLRRAGTNPCGHAGPGATARLTGCTGAAANQTAIDWLSTAATSLGRQQAGRVIVVALLAQQDLVDGQAARTAEDERDDLGDIFGGNLGLVVELLDAWPGAGVSDVVRQL